VPEHIILDKKDLDMLKDNEFGLRDYINVVRAKSAHPLGRSKTAKSVRSLAPRRADQSLELSTSVLHASLNLGENKYEKEQHYKEKKEKMREFGDFRLYQKASEKNTQFLEELYKKHEMNRDVYLDRKTFQKKLQEKDQEVEEKVMEQLEREKEKMEKKMNEHKVNIMKKIRLSKKRVKKRYYQKYPNVPPEVRELRDLEYKQKYLKDPPLFKKKEEEWIESEKKKLKDVKTELHATRNQPLDFVVVMNKRET